MTEPKAESDTDLSLIYDAQCPVCSAYSAAVAVDEKVAPGVQRIDARGDHPLIAQARAAGLDLDEGMVVVHDGRLHHGADALHLMAKLAPHSGVRNRLNRLLFGSRTLARLSYPVLRLGRNTLLRLLGRSKIGK